MASLQKNLALFGVVLGFALAACSPKRIAEESLAEALAAQGDTFDSDDDPQLIHEAVPFGLKVMETLLADLPKHRGLLLAACSGFTSYGYAFIQEDADETSDLQKTKLGHERARRLYARARGYCLRALDVAHPGLAAALQSGDGQKRTAALAQTTKADVPTLYWTAAAWSLLIGNSLNDLGAIGQLPAAAAAGERAAALDPGWNEGAIDDYLISLDAARGVDQGGGPAKAKADFDRSTQLSGGLRLGPILSYAEGVLLPAQDRKGFEAALRQVLAFDVDQPKARSNRLANVVAQHRARWLQTRLDELFL